MQEISSDTIIPIDFSFKVFAGPGAGKTHWLTLHVRNVLQNSRKLSKTGKVACITYTTTAKEEVQTRLGNVAEKVEVSTFHSFLYKNILKPYGFTLKKADGKNLLNLKKLDGHYENIPSLYNVLNWKRLTKQIYLKDNEGIINCLSDLDWQFVEENQLELRPRKEWKAYLKNYSIRKDSYEKYKEICWDQGKIHHEDVLYFSYRIFLEQPRAIEFLIAKFPYIFVDEFQDSHPIQTKILEMIGQKGSVIGVIGDPAQTIYGFQGSSIKTFFSFSPPNLKTYLINGNRRSTGKIVDLLNKFRKDEIKQVSIRQQPGFPVSLLVGDRSEIVDFLIKNHRDLKILARDNSTVNQLKNKSKDIVKENLWLKSRSLDGNMERQDLIHNTIYAMKFLIDKKFSDAHKKICQSLNAVKFNDRSISASQKKRLGTIFIETLFSRYNEFLNFSVTEYHNEIFHFLGEKLKIKIGAKITSGKYKSDFSDKFFCQDLIHALTHNESIDQIITIHQAKGAQFNAVLVVLKKEKDFENIIAPNLTSDDDEGRIYYVALSRAKNHLYITVPKINYSLRELNDRLGISIQEFQSLPQLKN